MSAPGAANHGALDQRTRPIIFGLISVSVLALFVVPALYLLLTPADAGEEKVLD